MYLWLGFSCKWWYLLVPSKWPRFTKGRRKTMIWLGREGVLDCVVLQCGFSKYPPSRTGVFLTLLFLPRDCAHVGQNQRPETDSDRHMHFWKSFLWFLVLRMCVKPVFQQHEDVWWNCCFLFVSFYICPASCTLFTLESVILDENSVVTVYISSGNRCLQVDIQFFWSLALESFPVGVNLNDNQFSQWFT